ncbi:unnamed protein product [Paramecium pentaurelia]|uniref:Transmembrane protein n=1 Tax=Paramecium pentaurelia TaxID=43138 RepID=A0A8S1YJ95_9CILI|nr:unnamed protein product [Paramecium pentaurelia]
MRWSPLLQLHAIFAFCQLVVQPKNIFYIYSKIKHQQIYSNFIYNDKYQQSEEYLIFPISITIQKITSLVTVAMLAQNYNRVIKKLQLSINKCSIRSNSCHSSGCFNQELFSYLFFFKRILHHIYR